MYLVLNVAISHNWGFEKVCYHRANECSTCDVYSRPTCLDCENPGNLQLYYIYINYNLC